MSAASQPSSQLCGGSGSFPRGSHRKLSASVQSSCEHVPRPSPCVRELCSLPRDSLAAFVKRRFQECSPSPRAACFCRGSMWGALTSMQACCPFALLDQTKTKQKPNLTFTASSTPFLFAPFCSKSPLTERVILLVIPSLPPSF